MSLIAAFEKLASRHPRKVALITEKSQLNFLDILNMVHAFDVALANHGIGFGARILVNEKRADFCIPLALLASHRQFSICFAGSDAAGEFAAERIITTNAGLAGTDARAVLVEPTWFSGLGTLPLPDYSTTGGLASYAFQSSGSTGLPKLIESTEAERLENALRGGGFGELDFGRRRFLSTLSASSGWAMTGNLTALLGGGSVVSLSEEALNVLQYIDLHHVDTLSTTPAVIRKMLDVPEAEHYIASLRDIRLGGAIAGSQLLNEFRRLSRARIHVGYGASETGTCFRAQLEPDQTFDTGYIGRFFRTDMEVAFFDEGLNILPDGDEGLVGFRFRGDGRRRYLSVRDSDPHAGFVGEYFITGDIMRRRNEGYYLLGRLKNIINFGGNKFRLEAIQERLETEFSETTFALLVDASGDGLERLVVIHTSGSELSAKHLSRILQQSFPGVEVRRTVQVLDMPLTDSGKPDYAMLRKEFLAN